MSSGRLWPIAVVAVLGITVAANAWLLWAANDEQSRAFEPDYYRKALAWDSTAAVAARSAALGWRVTATLEPAGDRTARLLVRLADRDGQAVTGASVRATATPIARADLVTTLPLRERDGAYQAWFPLVYRGLYEVRVEATRGGDVFAASLRGSPGPDPFQP